MPEAVRVRFAPSPTGALHVGGARTAIYNWAFARQTGGTFILRIDDTDPERSTPENTSQILRSLAWLGVDWDEGPEVGGSHGPYFQTQRAEHYSAALERMKSNGAAYPCFCSSAELESKRASARAGEGVTGYDRTCRRLSAEAVAERLAAGEPRVWRLTVPEDRGDIIVDDAVRGETVFPASAMDDFVLVRTDGTPTYNFATVVDDAEMEITHIIRGDDHLSNTPRQILVFEALCCSVPRFAHLSMIWGADGKKLSKRHGATSVEAFREEGYLPEALLNYLALLGWSLDGDTTIISADVLTSNFSLDRISKNPAIFDFDKLDWMNGAYIRDQSPTELAVRITPLLVDAGLLTAAEAELRREWLEALALLVHERLKRLDEVVPSVAFLLVDTVELDPSAVEKVLAKSGMRALLEGSSAALDAAEPFEAATIQVALRDTAESLGAKPKDLFQGIRVAVSGTTVSPPLFESLELLGKDRSIARIQAALPHAAQ